MYLKRSIITNISKKIEKVRCSCCKKKTFLVLLIVGIVNIAFYNFGPAAKPIDPELLSYIFDDKLYTFWGNSFVVNTSKCKIPDINPWSRPSVELIKFRCRMFHDSGHPNCSKRYPRKWMYSDGMKLHVNQSAMIAEGFSFKSGHCCYRVIERVEQSLEKYDFYADRRVRLSEKCHKIHSLETFIAFEFIQVFCMSDTHITRSDVYYRDLFAFPQLGSAARRKIEVWKKNKYIPPNVVILMLDTVSRLTFRRLMPDTLKVLREVGAVEMFGYTKVEDSTWPNTIAALSGLSKNEYKKLCHPTKNHSQDTCPLIWKDFDKAGYLTVLAEDQGREGLFSYFRRGTGFVRKPTDFYFRPMAISWIKALGVPYYTDYAKCIFQTRVDKFVLQYLMDVFEQSLNKAPIFLHSLFGVFSHDCSEDLRFNDGPISDFLKFLIQRHPNTVIILKGDHGNRIGPYRGTLMGWYDDKLPVMWMYLPAVVQQKFPTWKKGLQQNMNRLNSHFDTYQTLVQILKNYGVFTRNHSRRGQSLFRPVPENRTCQDAGVPSQYCPCELPNLLRFSVDARDVYTKKILDNAVDEAIVYLSKTLPSTCAKFHIRGDTSLISAKLQKLPSGIVYHITFMAHPGKFNFEARVTLIENTDDRTGQPKFRINRLQDITPLNKTVPKSDCVEDPMFKRYCYCI